MVPYLENSTVLQFVLPERQDEWLRSVVLSAMRSLKQRKLIAEIPRKFQRDAPKIKLLLLSVAVLASRKTIRRRHFLCCFRGAFPTLETRIDLPRQARDKHREHSKQIVKTDNHGHVWQGQPLKELTVDKLGPRLAYLC